MKIVVIGGRGRIGSRLVSTLQRDCGVGGNGLEVLPASRSGGVDVMNRAELRQALAGARVVVDVVDAPTLGDAALHFFESAGSNLLTAEAAAGLEHHVALSVAGVDRNPAAGYLRAKLAQERLIESSGIPYTIVRSTPFFESIARIAEAVAVDGSVRASPALVQPVAADDVVAVLAEVALGAPVGGPLEIAGPERLPFDEFVMRYLASRGDSRPVISDVHARYFGLELNDKSLAPGPKPRIGPTRFEDWLRSNT